MANFIGIPLLGEGAEAEAAPLNEGKQFVGIPLVPQGAMPAPFQPPANMPGVKELGGLPGVPNLMPQVQTTAEARSPGIVNRKGGIGTLAGKLNEPEAGISQLPQNTMFMAGAGAVEALPYLAQTPAQLGAAGVIQKALYTYLAGTQAESASESFKQAAKLYKEGNYSEAVKWLGQGSFDSGLAFLGLRGVAGRQDLFVPEQARPEPSVTLEEPRLLQGAGEQPKGGRVVDIKPLNPTPPEPVAPPAPAKVPAPIPTLEPAVVQVPPVLAPMPSSLSQGGPVVPTAGSLPAQGEATPMAGGSVYRGVELVPVMQPSPLKEVVDAQDQDMSYPQALEHGEPVLATEEVEARPQLDLPSRPQAALTKEGNLEIDFEKKRAAKELGSSLYSGQIGNIITKELVQNAFDAVRPTGGGQVHVEVNNNTGLTNAEGKKQVTITVSDSGIGMTLDDLGNYWTRIGNPGKDDIADASGGFGMAKAAFLLNGDAIAIKTVAVWPDGQKRMVVASGTPDDFLDGKVKPEVQPVPQQTPTGTVVTSTVPKDYIWEDKLKGFLQNTANSLNAPGQFTATLSGDNWGKAFTETYVPDKEILGGRSLIAELDAPGAKLGLYATQGNLMDAIISSFGGLRVAVNNNGIYQFDADVKLPPGLSQLRGVPKSIVVDVRATVKPGHPEYPFQINREGMRDVILKTVQDFVTNNILKKAIQGERDFLAQKFAAMPRMATKMYDIPVYDAGARLSAYEMAQLQTNLDLIRLAETMASVGNKIIRILQSPKAVAHLPKGIGKKTVRFGLVFSEGNGGLLYGVHIPHPGKPEEATVFINPFAFDHVKAEKVDPYHAKASDFVLSPELLQTIKNTEQYQQDIRGIKNNHTGGYKLTDEDEGTAIRRALEWSLGLDPSDYLKPRATKPLEDPDQIAWGLLQTIIHELAHDENYGWGDQHNNSMMLAMMHIVSTLGAYNDTAASAIAKSIRQAGSDSLRPGLIDALSLYDESRGRGENEKDIFGGQESSSGTPGFGPKEFPRNAGNLPSRGEGPVGEGELLPDGTEYRGEDFEPADPKYLAARAALQRALEAGVLDQAPPEKEVPTPEQVEALKNLNTVLQQFKGPEQGLGLGGTQPPVDGDLKSLSQGDIDEILRNVDKFGWFSKHFLNLIQWGERNPHLVPLHDYIRHISEWWEFKNTILKRANEDIEMWQKLGPIRENILAKMLLTVSEKSHYLRRRLEPQEIMEIAKKLGADEEVVNLHDLLDADFRLAFGNMREKVLARIDRRTRGMDPGYVKALKDRAVKEFDAMEDRHFFPWSRFGQHTVIVKATQSMHWNGRRFRKGQTVLAEHFEGAIGRLEQKRRYAELVKDLQGKQHLPVHIRMDKLVDSAQELTGFPPVLFDILEKKLGLSEAQTYQMRKVMVDLAPSSAFIKHLSRKRGVAGYSQDAQRAFAKYFHSYANNLARMEFADTLENDLNKLRQAGDLIQQGDASVRRSLIEAVEKHYIFTMNPGNDLAALRGGIFNFWFAFNPKQVLVNLTQIPMFAFPYLAGSLQKMGKMPGVADGIAARELARAMVDISKTFNFDKEGLWKRMAVSTGIGTVVGGAAAGPAGAVGGAIAGALHGIAGKTSFRDIVEPELGKALARAVKMGFINESFASEVAGLAHGNMLSRYSRNYRLDKLARRVTMEGVLPFKVGEEYNRRVTFMAAFRIARQYMGMDFDQAFDFAHTCINDTMFEYARWNRIPLARGKKAVAFIFKTYQQQSLWFAFTRPGRGRFWLLALLLGGLRALPGWEEIKELMSGGWTYLNEILGTENSYKDLEVEARKLMIAIGGNPDLFIHGLSGETFGLHTLGQAFGLPVPALDFSPSFRSGGIVPGLEPILGAVQGRYKPEEAVGKFAQDLLGASGSVGMNFLRAASDKQSKADLRWMEISMPTMLRNLTKAGRYYWQHKAINSAGEAVVKFNPNSIEDQVEILGQVLGVTPQRINTRMEEAWYRKEMIQYYTTRRELLINERAAAQGDREASAEANKKILEFNRIAPVPFRVQSIDELLQGLKTRVRNQTMREAGFPTQKRLFGLYQDARRAFPEQ